MTYTLELEGFLFSFIVANYVWVMMFVGRKYIFNGQLLSWYGIAFNFMISVPIMVMLKIIKALL